MKKIHIIVLLFVFALTGCSNLTSNDATSPTANAAQIIIDDLPEYDGNIYIKLNRNKPEFSVEDKERTNAYGRISRNMN